MTTTELDVIEDEPLEDVAEQLTKREAVALNKKIKTASERASSAAFDLLSLLEQAADGSIHLALGYKSWTEWWSENVQIEVGDKDDRKRLTSIMSGKGMSQRAIAASLGVDQKTVSNDLRDADTGEENSSPEATVGLDGKEYKRNGAAAEEDSDDDVIDGEVVEDEDEAPARREPLPAQMTEAVHMLVDGVNLLAEVTEDDRFVKARKGFSANHLEPLQQVLAILQEAVDKLAV